LLPESRGERAEDEQPVGLHEIMETFKQLRLRPLLLQKLALSLGLYGWFGVIALYLKGQLGFTLVQTTLYFSFFAAFNVLINVTAIGRTSRGIGDRAMSNIGLASLVISFALVPFVHATAMLIFVMALFSLGMAFANTGITALISNTASARDQGTVLSVSSSLDSFSGILGPPASTGLLARFGSPFSGIESVAFTFISLVLGLLAAQRTNHQAATIIEETTTV
jgi:predicted MFS family arabinose efflux permease